MEETRIEVNVLINDSENVEKFIEQAKKLDFIATKSLTFIGVVCGTIPESNIEKLKIMYNVLTVSENRRGNFLSEKSSQS